MKKTIALILLCGILSVCCVTTFFAADAGREAGLDDTGGDVAQTAALADISEVKQKAYDKLSVSAGGAALYCVNNGQLIYGKKHEERVKMASTTKVMTALLCLEEAASDNKKVKFTKEMIAEGSSMYLEVGEVVTLRDLAVGMMLPSGNDAANAAAVTIAGSIEEFAVLMNKRAKQIGMKNTNFVTPSGLDDEEHYSTPYDMALLLAYAMENEDFAQITGKKSMRVDFAEPEGENHTYSNHNRLLSSYEYCIGGKTGFTKAAGRCLVSVAEKDGLRFVAVTMDAPDDWDDHTLMYDFGFDNLACLQCDDTKANVQVNVVGGTADTVMLNCPIAQNIVVSPENAERVQRFVYAPGFLYAPVSMCNAEGKAVYILDGKVIAENRLKPAENIEAPETGNGFWGAITGIFG